MPACDKRRSVARPGAHYGVSLLGHAKLETTALYTRVAVNTVRDIESPLDRLDVSLTKRTPPG